MIFHAGVSAAFVRSPASRVRYAGLRPPLAPETGQHAGASPMRQDDALGLIDDARSLSAQGNLDFAMPDSHPS